MTLCRRQRPRLGSVAVWGSEAAWAGRL